VIAIVIPLALLLLPVTNIAARGLLPFLSPSLSQLAGRAMELSVFNTTALTLPRHRRCRQLIINISF